MMAIDNNNKNAQELYEQFMAELDAGAKEYDNLIASGKAPALSKAKAVPLRRTSNRRYWYAAACLVAVIFGCAYMSLMNEKTDNIDVAQVADVEKPVVKQPSTIQPTEPLPVMEEKKQLAQVKRTEVGIAPQKADSASEEIYTAELDEVVFNYTEANDANSTPLMEDDMDDFVISGKFLCANCDDNSLYIREYYVTNN